MKNYVIYLKINTQERIADAFGKTTDNFCFDSPAFEIYNDNIVYYNGQKLSVTYLDGKSRSFKFIYKAMKSIALYINNLTCKVNLTISPERFFWAKVNELISYEILPKECRKIFGTYYNSNNELKVYIKQRTDLEDLTAKDRQLYMCVYSWRSYYL